MFIRLPLKKESFRVGYLPGTTAQFGICIGDDPIPISGAYPGDIITLEEAKIKSLETAEKSNQYIEGNYIQRFSKFRDGKIALNCPNVDVKCHRCPWREMSAEMQLRLRIKILGDFLFTNLKIRQDEVTEDFSIKNADQLEMVDQSFPYHSLYFGTGKHLKHRSIGTIYKSRGDAFIQSIHRQCRLMTPEIRETIGAVNDWWVQFRETPGWDSGQESTNSKLLSLSIHHLQTKNEILVRIHAIGRGPNDYLLCSSAATTHLSETEAIINTLISDKLLFLGFTGKMHTSVMLRNPFNNVRFTKILTGENIVFDSLHVNNMELLVPIRMAGTKIAYDRHPSQQRLLCRDILKCVNRYAPKDILVVSERELLDCTTLSIVLCLCKAVPSLRHLIYPLIVVDVSSQESEFTSPRGERALLSEVMSMNKAPQGVLRDSFYEQYDSADISVVCYTKGLFRTSTEDAPHPILIKIVYSKVVYLIGTNLVDNPEIRKAIVYLLRAGFQVSCARTISNFHSTEIGGFIELQR